MIGDAVQRVRVRFDEEMKLLHQQAREDHPSDHRCVVIAAQLNGQDLIGHESEGMQTDAHLFRGKKIVDQGVLEIGDGQWTEMQGIDVMGEMFLRRTGRGGYRSPRSIGIVTRRECCSARSLARSSLPLFSLIDTQGIVSKSDRLNLDDQRSNQPGIAITRQENEVFREISHQLRVRGIGQSIV